MPEPTQPEPPGPPVSGPPEPQPPVSGPPVPESPVSGPTAPEPLVAGPPVPQPPKPQPPKPQPTMPEAPEPQPPASGPPGARPPGAGPLGAGLRVREALLVGLAAGSGATDAFSFVALGHVFTSVVTGNLVLVGVSIGALSFTDVLDIVIAVGCYLLATAAAARLLAGRVPSDTVWNAALTRMLLGEAAVQAVVVVLWLCAPIRPLLIGLCAVAMGAQSATVRAVPGTGLSTTYLTGTLTALVASFATGRRTEVGRAASIGVLATLVVGAIAEAALLRVVPQAGPVLPLVVSLAVAAGAASAAGG